MAFWTNLNALYLNSGWHWIPMRRLGALQFLQESYLSTSFHNWIGRNCPASRGFEKFSVYLYTAPLSCIYLVQLNVYHHKAGTFSMFIEVLVCVLFVSLHYVVSCLTLVIGECWWTSNVCNTCTCMVCVYMCKYIRACMSFWHKNEFVRTSWAAYV